jgi:outer membrane protein assembly factor BamB
MRAANASLLFALLGAGLLLAGCGGGKSVRQPAVLQSIEERSVLVESAWRSGSGPDADELELGLTTVVTDDAVFTADAHGNVYALDRESGDGIWEVDTDLRISAGPTVEGDQVLVATRDAEVLALSRAEGEELWRSQVTSEVVAAPASNGRTVVVRSVDGRVTALSAEDGSEQWITARTVPPLTLRGMAPPLIAGPVVVTGLETGRLIAQRLSDGETAWEAVASVPSGRSELERIADIDARMLLAGDTIYALSYGGDVVAINRFNGEERWRRDIRSYTGAAISDDGSQLFVTAEDGAVWGLQTANGAAAWKNEALAWRRLSAPAFHAGHVAVADYEGYVHYLSPRDGAIVGRGRPLGARVDAHPVVDGALLYIGDVEGRLAALDARTE